MIQARCSVCHPGEDDPDSRVISGDPPNQANSQSEVDVESPPGFTTYSQRSHNRRLYPPLGSDDGFT